MRWMASKKAQAAGNTMAAVSLMCTCNLIKQCKVAAYVVCIKVMVSPFNNIRPVQKQNVLAAIASILITGYIGEPSGF